MSYNPFPGMPLIAAETEDGTYGPFAQGNNGTFFQRNPILFTVAGTFGGASVALMTITPEDSSPLVPVLDDLGNAIVWTAAELTEVRSLPGGYPIYLVITDASGTTSITVSVGTGNAAGYLVSP